MIGVIRRSGDGLPWPSDLAAAWHLFQCTTQLKYAATVKHKDTEQLDAMQLDLDLLLAPAFRAEKRMRHQMAVHRDRQTHPPASRW